MSGNKLRSGGALLILVTLFMADASAQVRDDGFTPVRSDQISAVKYDPAQDQLTIMFREGGIVTHAEVPDSLYQEFMQNSMKGGFYKGRIKDQCPILSSTVSMDKDDKEKDAEPAGDASTGVEGLAAKLTKALDNAQRAARNAVSAVKDLQNTPAAWRADAKAQKALRDGVSLTEKIMVTIDRAVKMDEQGESAKNIEKELMNAERDAKALDKVISAAAGVESKDVMVRQALDKAQKATRDLTRTIDDALKLVRKVS